MAKNPEAIPSVDKTFESSASKARGFIQRHKREVAAGAFGLSLMGTTACGPDGDVSAAPTPEQTVTTEMPVNVEVETDEERYERYYEIASIPAGLSTEALGEAIADRWEKWRNVTMVDVNAGDVFRQQQEEDGGEMSASTWSHDYADTYTDAFTAALTDSGNPELRDFIYNQNRDTPVILHVNINGDSADIEPYQSYVDVLGTTEMEKNDLDQRIIKVDIDIWDNSDKNFVDDNPNKGIDIWRYTMVIDESEGRAVIADIIDSEKVG